MFCDLVGSTALSEEMGPEDYRKLIGHFRDVLTQTVSEWRGYIARYMGDGLLAYFGFPQAREDDPQRAAICGIEIIRRLADTKAKFTCPLSVKIGIATGTVIAGDLVGTGAAQENVITGFTANIAARLQEISEANTVTVSDDTYLLIRKHVECSDLGERRLKGISKPYRVWRVIREQEAGIRFNSPHAGALGKFVDRAEEINIMLAAWQRARAGDTQVASLSGDAGIGKSRLLAAFREQISGDSHSFLGFQCSPYHTATPLYPVARRLRSAADLMSPGSSQAQLLKLEGFVEKQGVDPTVAVPLMASLLAIPVGQSYRPLDIGPLRQRALTFEVLLNQLAELAARAPVLCVVDDAQWLDPTTTELLELFVTKVKCVKIFLLVIGREGRWLRVIQGIHCTAVSVKRLSAQHGREIVQWTAGSDSLPRAIEDRILDRAEGNPLFLEELARHAARIIRGGQQPPAIAGNLVTISIPDSLADALMARIDQSEDGRELLEICAVLAREVTPELLSLVSKAGNHELSKLLSRLVSLGLMRVHYLGSRASYSLGHSLVREAVYASLLTDRRKCLHAQIARAIEQHSPEIAQFEPETMAVHYLEAEDATKALPYVLAAGQRAIERCGHTEAMHFLERGLECLMRSHKSDGRDRSEFELRCMLARAHIFRSSWAAPEVEEQYTRALALSDSFQDKSSRIPVVWGLATSSLLKGRIVEAVVLGEELVSIASAATDPDAISAAHSAMTIFKFHSGGFEAAIDHMEHALAHYRPHAISKFYLQYATDRKGQAMRGGSLAHWCLGNTGRAIALDRQQREQALSRNNSYEIAYALGISCLLYSLHGDTQVVIDLAERAINLARQEGFAFRVMRAEIFLELARATQQPSSTRLQRCAKLIDAYVAEGNRMGTSAWLAQLGDLWTRIGEFQQAQDCIDGALAYLHQSGERFAEAELYRVRGNLLTADGDRERGEQSLRQAIAVAATQKAKSWELRARLSLATLLRDDGQPQRAHDVLLAIYNAFAQQPRSADLAEARAQLNA